ncbi:MAG: ATP-binding protein, partial [Streptomycetales bacterium]
EQRQPDGLDEHGRGLLLVTTLAHRWGVRPLPSGGKAVWFEITLALDDPRRARRAEDTLAGCVTDERQLAQLSDATL